MKSIVFFSYSVLCDSKLIYFSILLFFLSIAIIAIPNELTANKQANIPRCDLSPVFGVSVSVSGIDMSAFFKALYAASK